MNPNSPEAIDVLKAELGHLTGNARIKMEFSMPVPRFIATIVGLQIACKDPRVKGTAFETHCRNVAEAFEDCVPDAFPMLKALIADGWREDCTFGFDAFMSSTTEPKEGQ